MFRPQETAARSASHEIGAKGKSFLPLQHRNNERFSQKNAVHAHITLVPQNAEQTQTAFVPQGAGRRKRR